MPRRWRRGPRPGGSSFGRVCDTSAGQAGVLAMVMTAGAMRVMVSAGPACAKDEGDLDLRARCRSRSTVFLYCPRIIHNRTPTRILDDSRTRQSAYTERSALESM